MIEAWSKTQNSISLSSAEAELIAMVKLSTELLGLMSLARDLDCRLHGRVWADSSAALAVVKRSGAGKLRHINISLLWVQEQQKLNKLVYEKVPGQANPADLFTKGVGREKLQQFAWASGQTFLDGRAEKSLQAQGVCVFQVADTCDPSKGQVALRITQDESKMSESVHAEFMNRRATNEHRQRATRTIGAMQTSCIAPIVLRPRCLTALVAVSIFTLSAYANPDILDFCCVMFVIDALGAHRFPAGFKASANPLDTRSIPLLPTPTCKTQTPCTCKLFSARPSKNV